MKRFAVLLVILAWLLSACMGIDEEDVPTAPEITAPREPWELTIPLPTDQAGHLKGLD